MSRIWEVKLRSLKLVHNLIDPGLQEQLSRDEFYSALRASPFGPPGRALSPLRRCRSNLNENVENLLADWRRGKNSNPRWAFDTPEDS